MDAPPIVDTEYSLASAPERLGAFLIDSVCIVIINLLLSLVLPSSIADSKGFTILIAYFIYFPFSTAIYQASPGKLAMKMKVVTNDYQRLSGGKVLMRECLGKWLAPLCIGHIWLLFNSRNKCAWDYLAGTLVVIKRRPALAAAS